VFAALRAKKNITRLNLDAYPYPRRLRGRKDYCTSLLRCRRVPDSRKRLPTAPYQEAIQCDPCGLGPVGTSRRNNDPVLHGIAPAPARHVTFPRQPTLRAVPSAIGSGLLTPIPSPCTEMSSKLPV